MAVCRQKHMARTALHSTRLGGQSEALRGAGHSEAITRLVGPVAVNKATHEHRPSLVHQAPAQRRGNWRQGLWKNGRGAELGALSHRR